MSYFSLTRVKSVWTDKWPQTIRSIDFSFNMIKDGSSSFNCAQFMMSLESLESIRLNNNHLKSFKQFIDNCGSLLSNYHNNASMTIDLRNNFFESIDSVFTKIETKEYDVSSDFCSKNEASNSVNLLLQGNPLICDCDENTWWSYINQIKPSNLFNVLNRQYCLRIGDYEQLSCESISAAKLALLENENKNSLASSSKASRIMRFGFIRSDLIKPKLFCPYKQSCATSSCECKSHFRNGY
jgi:hypothetical protein